ncbi:hypothetical protein [Bacillus thermotolerans]|uniref:Uncharacterized protein n=1 Tax=Bacillus thermotolerans TaxID=1221996 RepID=A0A0F5HIT8_BACTR|nr:hypothetical protein [Bacillus thermotolerans]KKB33314.1 hypothetical protein QY97_03548 [Bacillus thermotolerans]KKB37374.1 hypothetical protein QY96_03201 [Bacillus thermotolerans]KKB41630.1 hypothetical protein QY95_00632 [Bacillus thermotolerans]
MTQQQQLLSLMKDAYEEAQKQEVKVTDVIELIKGKMTFLETSGK